MWGDRDRSHPATDPRRARALGVDVEVVRVDDAGHFPELEAPVRFAEIVTTLIDRT
ncbi:MAG TPA: hypothetical protein VM734_24740 [Kofleriaceae bacterium]|nr:hypothetical protein [Kofleriaceae bacterium]